MAEGRSWRGRGIEGLTIVVSILLALLADAAWDYRADRADERQLLEALRAEFEEAAEEVANDIGARDVIIEQTERVLLARRAGGTPVAADSLQVVLTELLNWRFYTPGHSVLQDAIVSGRLDLIRSDVIRTELLGYIQARDRLPVFEAMERDFVAERMEPYLGAEIALDLVMVGNPDPVSLAGAARGFEVLIAEPTFGSLLFVRRDRSRQAQIYSGIVQGAIARVLRALDPMPPQ